MSIIKLEPNQGLAGVPNDVLLYGANFMAGMTAQIGGVPLQQVTVNEVDAAQAGAVVPSAIAPGLYDVVVQNPNGDAATLPGGYIAINPAGVDLAVMDADLWLDPPTTRAGERATIGVNVHRSGGSGSLTPAVRFFLGDSPTGAPLGDAVSQPLGEGNDVIGSAAVAWTPASAGMYTITAVIDPDNVIAESSEANNTAIWRITVLSEADELADKTPPVIDSLSINNGSQIATSPGVTLTLSAHDQDGGAVVAMYLVERVYSNAARRWVVRQESGWIPYASSYPFTLDETGGAHYVQVWAADMAGNRTTMSSQALINYTPQQEEIRMGQVRVYRLRLAPGGSVTANLSIATGDADLYVWNENGALVGYSNRSGAETDQVNVLLDAGGMHQFEVYGYTDSVYQLVLQLPAAVNEAQVAQAAAKPLPAEPVVAATQEPARYQALPPVLASNQVYLPVVGK